MFVLLLTGAMLLLTGAVLLYLDLITKANIHYSGFLYIHTVYSNDVISS